MQLGFQMPSMIDSIEKRLRELIPPRDETIFEAARYSLLLPGKRFRPLLTLATAGVYGVDPFSVLNPACAMEMIHTYSLIHDDLPCMDDDSLRRGKPTLHKVYGEAMALLAGDYLLTYAFEVLASTKNLNEGQRLHMIQLAAMRSGAPGMLGGQAIDIESKGKEIDEDTLLHMHCGKTASLLTACLEIGSWAASCPPSPLLYTIGRELGLAYQFQDDLLDATSTTALLGKTARSDASKNKPTAVSFYGVEKVQDKLKKLKTSIFRNLEKLPNQGSQLAILLHWALGLVG